MSDAEMYRTPWLPFDGQDRPGGNKGCLEDDAETGALRERVRALEAERERLLDHLRHVDRVAQAGLMTAGLAHDLANQVTAVAGSAELALLHATPDAVREGLDGVLQHARRMHDTIEAFLAFMRHREHRVRVLPVAELIDAVQRLVAPIARADGVVVLTSAPRAVLVRADRQLLEQALVNLVFNAVRAASEGGGRVTLTAATPAPGRVRISVRDTGGGIPEDVRAHLFEPFVTGNAETGGHGLGMYVVRQIVEHYGGTIDVDSGPAGTRIDVDLAAAAE